MNEVSHEEIWHRFLAYYALIFLFYLQSHSKKKSKNVQELIAINKIKVFSKTSVMTIKDHIISCSTEIIKKDTKYIMCVNFIL